MDLSLLTKHLGEMGDRLPLSEIQELPLLPLPNVVLMPGSVVPIHVMDESHTAMVERTAAEDGDIIVCFAPLGRDRAMMMSSICGAGRLIVVDDFGDGRKNIIVEGDYRVEIVNFVKDTPHLTVRARALEDVAYEDNEAKHLSFLQLVKRWLFLMGHVPTHYFPVLDFFKRPHEVADFIASYFFPDYTLKQQLLETLDQAERVKIVEEILIKGIDWLGQHPVDYHLLPSEG